jgi:hypothetical protein
MPILTGRSRTLRWEGVAEGTASITHECVDIPDPNTWVATDEATGIFEILGLLGKPVGLQNTRIYLQAGAGSNEPQTCDSPSRTATNEYLVRVETGMGDFEEDTHLIEWIGSDADGTKSSDFELEWSIEAEARERETIYELDDNDADKFPGLAILDGTNRVTGYSAGPKDHLHGRGIFWTERIIPSTTITVTAVLKVDGSTVASVSASDTVSGSQVWNLVYALSSTVRASGNTVPFGTTVLFQGVSLDGSGTTYNRTVSGQGAVASLGGAWAQGLGGVAQATVEIYPKIVYDFAGITRKFDTAYDGTVTVQTDGRNGEPVFEDVSTSSWSRTWEQLTYNYTSSIGPTAGSLVFAQGPAIDYRAPVRAWLSSASLASAGEEPTDMRLLFRGRRWNAYSVALAATIDLDTGAPANWTASANGTLSGTTETRVTASGGTSGMLRAFDPAANPEAYRYMRLRVRGSAAMTLRMKLTGRERVKNYRFDVTTSWASVDVDLMAPLNAVGRVHEQDTRWPLKPPGDAEEFAPIDEGWLFGVNWLTLLDLDGVPDGEWLEVDYVQMVRLTTPNLSFLPEFNNPVTRWVDGSTTTSDYRTVFADVDGKLSLDWFGLTRVSGGSTSYGLLSLGTGSLNLANYIAGVPGWSVSTTSGPDAHHGLNDPAFWAGGSGATYDWSSELWSTWIDKDPSSALTVPAQALWDVVQVYPGAGDVWTSGDYDDPTKLRAAKLLRGRAFGIVAERGAALATQDVRLQEPTWTDVDAETTDSRGRYTTGSNHGHSALAHRVVWDDDGTDRIRGWTASEWVARRWHGASFSVLPYSGSLWIAVGKARARIYRGFTEDGRVKIQSRAVAGIASAADWGTAIDTGIDARDHFGIISHEHADGRLWLIWATENGEVKAAFSIDGGTTWSSAVTVGSGYFPAGVIWPSGGQTRYWLDGSTIKGRDYSAQGAAIASEFSTGITDAEEAGLSAAIVITGQGDRKVSLAYQNTSGDLTVLTSADGRTSWS